MMEREQLLPQLLVINLLLLFLQKGERLFIALRSLANFFLDFLERKTKIVVRKR
jgi:hypothetical protein